MRIQLIQLPPPPQRGCMRRQGSGNNPTVDDHWRHITGNCFRTWRSWWRCDQARRTEEPEQHYLDTGGHGSSDELGCWRSTGTGCEEGKTTEEERPTPGAIYVDSSRANLVRGGRRCNSR